MISNVNLHSPIFAVANMDDATKKLFASAHKEMSEKRSKEDATKKQQHHKS